MYGKAALRTKLFNEANDIFRKAYDRLCFVWIKEIRELRDNSAKMEVLLMQMIQSLIYHKQKGCTNKLCQDSIKQN